LVTSEVRAQTSIPASQSIKGFRGFSRKRKAKEEKERRFAEAKRRR
jgi:hypothetical protein